MPEHIKVPDVETVVTFSRDFRLSDGLHVGRTNAGNCLCHNIRYATCRISFNGYGVLKCYMGCRSIRFGYLCL